MKAIPTTRALFLCDAVIVEEGTRKVSLVNSFGRLRAADCPAPLAPFLGYARLINGLGTVSLRMTIDRLDTMQTVYELGSELRFPDRFRETDVKFRVTACTLPRFGRYAVTLYADYDVLALTELELLPKEV